MTRHATLALLTSAALAVPTLAQDMMGPSPQLKRYDSWIGTWEGSGKWRMDAEAEAMGWTATSTYQKVMNGFFIMEKTRIEGEGMPGPLEMTVYFGWDNENQRHVKIEVANNGVCRIQEVHWPSDNTTVTLDSGMDPLMGTQMLERWVGTMNGETIKFTGEVAHGTGQFYTHVWGTMNKSSEEVAGLELGNGPFMPPAMMPAAAKAVPHMQHLGRMAGTYRTAGWWSMPGGPKQEFGGTETVAMHFGDQVMSFHTVSDPMEDMDGMRYEMKAFATYNVHRNRYEMLYMSNMGEIGKVHMWKLEDKLITGAMGPMYGLPTLSRGIMEFHDDGSVSRMVGHAMAGSGEPQKNFVCEYTKKEQ